MEIPSLIFCRRTTGSVEITADKTVVKATGHKFKWVIDKEPTETEDGYKHEECTVCGFRRNENTVIPATGDVKSEDDSNGEDVEADTSEKSPATGSGYEALALFAVILASGAGISAVGYGRKRKENVE